MSAADLLTRRAGPLVPDRLREGRRPSGRQTGVILFADIVGFTAMTEKARRATGERGVEQLTRSLNRVFADMIATVAAAGGDVLKFGGDALLVAFDDTGDAVFDSQARAIWCADRLQRLIRRRGGSAAAGLSLRIGMAAGCWSELVLGPRGERREHFVFGPAIKMALKTADAAEEGGCRLSAPVRAQAESAASVECIRVGAREWRLRFPRSRWELGAAISHPLGHASADIVDFVPVPLRPQLADGNFTPLAAGQHRRVSTLFVFWRGYGLGQRFSRPPPGLWPGVCGAIHRAARETGGLWARSDPGDTYHKILLLFGAPRAGGDDVDQALACAIHISRSFSKLKTRYPRLRWGIGLTTAIVYTGYVGGPDRHEFTAMGDGVNLAARLAARARQGVILTDETTRRQARRGLFRAGPTLHLKGFSRLVNTHRLAGHTTSPVGDVHRDIVEHPESLRRAFRSWGDMPRPVLHLTVAPDADARKFLRQLLSGLHLSGEDVGRIRFRPVDAAHPHGGLRRLLNALFGPAPEGKTGTGGGTSVPPGLPESLRPIFGRDKSLARLMDRLGVGAWTDRIAGAVSDALSTVPANSESLVWILDEAQHLSDIDREVFRKLEFRRRRDLRVIMVSQGVSSPDAGGDATSIHLGAVSIKELLEIAGPLLPEGRIPSRLLQYLHEKSGGMARLGCLYIDHLRSNGLLTPPRTRAGMWRVSDLESARLPDTMRAHYLAEIDRLPHASTVLAQALAVAGDGTTWDALQSYWPTGMDSADFTAALTPLTESGLIETHKEGRTVSLGFTDPACRQAVYETMSFAARESLHAQAARYWRTRGTAGSETAGEHLFLARDRMALPLLTRAGQRAHKLWLLGRAHRLLRWGLLVLANRFDPSYGRIVPPLPRRLTESHLALLEPLADVLQAQGQYREARTIYRRLASDAAGRGDHAAAGERRLAAARMDWYAGRYLRTLTETRAVMKAAHGKKMLMVKCEAGFLLGETYRRTGRMKEAESALRGSLRVGRHVGERSRSSDVLNALGLVQWNCGRLDDARRSFTAAMRLLPRGGSLAKRGQIANNLGILLEESGNLRAAARYYRKAFNIFDQLGHRRNRAYSLGNLANLHRHAARYERARAAYEEVELELRSIGERHAAAYTLGNLGDLACDFGDHDGALAAFRETLRFATQVGDAELSAECYARQAAVMMARHRLSEATRFIKRAREAAGRAGSREFVLRADLLAAELKLLHGRPGDAVETFRGCDREARTVGLRYYDLWATDGLGRSLLGCGDAGAAATIAREGISRARTSGYRWWEFRFAVLLLEAGERSKRPQAMARKMAQHLRIDIAGTIGDLRIQETFSQLPIVRRLASCLSKPVCPDPS